jgi:hypothetical protein
MDYGRNDQNKNIELNLLKDTDSMINVEEIGTVKRLRVKVRNFSYCNSKVMIDFKKV